MDPPVLSVEQQIKQLGDARKLVLSDANYYPQIIQGILQIVAQAARVELRRWVSDFFAEAFASPAIPPPQKETLSLIVLETLKNIIENPMEDSAVVKSVVQTAASIYPHVFRWMYVVPLLTFIDIVTLLQRLHSFYIGLHWKYSIIIAALFNIANR